MQSKTIIGVVLSFGVAFAMLGGAGIGSLFGEDPGNHETTRAIDKISEDAAVEEGGEGDGLSAEVAGDNEPTLVGLAISGGQFGAQLVVSIALLPITLMQLGLPSYAAVPLGGVAQIVGLIGLVQFIRGTEYL